MHCEPKLYVNIIKYSLNYEKIMKIDPMNSHNDLCYKTIIIRIHCKNEYINYINESNYCINELSTLNGH